MNFSNLCKLGVLNSKSLLDAYLTDNKTISELREKYSKLCEVELSDEDVQLIIDHKGDLPQISQNSAPLGQAPVLPATAQHNLDETFTQVDDESSCNIDAAVIREDVDEPESQEHIEEGSEPKNTRSLKRSLPTTEKSIKEEEYKRNKNKKQRTNRAMKKLRSSEELQKLAESRRSIASKAAELSNFFKVKKENFVEMANQNPLEAEFLWQQLLHQQATTLKVLENLISDLKGPQDDKPLTQIDTHMEDESKKPIWDSSYRVSDADKQFSHLPDSFETCSEYSKYFKPFVKKDMEDYEKSWKEEMHEFITFNSFSPDFKTFTYISRHSKLCLYTKFHCAETFGEKLMDFDAVVTKFDPKSGEVEANFQTVDALEERWKDRLHTSTIAEVYYEPNLDTYNKMLDVLSRYQVDDSAHKTYPTAIMKTILSKPKASLAESLEPVLPPVPPPDYRSLKPAQQLSIEQGLREPISLTWGPPGTGKTKTSVYLISQWAQLLSRDQGEKIFVCGPSNKSVDALTEYLYEVFSKMKDERGKPFLDKYPITRLLASRLELESLSPTVRQLTLEEKINQHPEYRGAQTSEEREVVKKRLYSKFLFRSRIICVTCASSISGLLGKLWLDGKFKIFALLIDEACLAKETEILIALQLALKYVRLVGDPCQLRPIVKLEELKNAGYDRSMFQRLQKLGFPCTMLNEQFRSHPMISKWYRFCVYGGNLLDGINEAQRDCPFFLPGVSCFQVNGKEQKEQKGKSWFNDEESNHVTSIVGFLTRNGVLQSEIGIITPYVAQKDKIKMKIEKFEEIQVNSVDAFQGSEKNFIIVSTVRSNHPQKAIGFLTDPNRFNVMVSRAKISFIVIGNLNYLQSAHPMWSNFVSYAKSKDRFFTQFLDEEKVMMIKQAEKERSEKARLEAEEKIISEEKMKAAEEKARLEEVLKYQETFEDPGETPMLDRVDDE